MKMLTKFIFTGLLGLSASFNALALSCNLNSIGGPLEEFATIDHLRIPAKLPIGSRLWTSQPMSRDVMCWAWFPRLDSGEYVYFYPNPDKVQVAPGIGVGIIYNGQDLGIIQPGQAGQKGWQTNMFRYGPESRAELGTVNYQVYLEKTGEITDARLGADQLSVFQLDGELGLNARGSNYRFTLTGLSNIEVLQCSASVELVTPEGVDFGEIQGWAAGDGKVASKDFSVLIRKDGCSDDFGLDVNFMPKDGVLTDATGLDMGNGATMRIYDNSNPKWINYNRFVSFADMTGKNEVIKSYTASLHATGDAKEGDFKKTVILLVNYL